VWSRCGPAHPEQIAIVAALVAGVLLLEDQEHPVVRPRQRLDELSAVHAVVALLIDVAIVTVVASRRAKEERDEDSREHGHRPGCRCRN
jgi:hypothetical protein